MRKDYDHLKPQQRRLLERGVEIIRTQFAEAIKGKDWEKKKQGRILKIVLYGSMARGKAVRDLGSGYRSDFDLLIVVSHPELVDDEFWYGVDDALTFEESLGATRYPFDKGTGLARCIPYMLKPMDEPVIHRIRHQIGRACDKTLAR